MKSIPLNKSQFYNMQSRKKLNALLFFDKAQYSQNEYKIYCTNKGTRLVEEPKGYTLQLHKRVYKFLNQIETPQYLFSSVKGKSHIDNAKFHNGNDYVVALDLSKFFPKCSINYVYKFFRYKLNMSHTNARFLSEITTIDIIKYELNPIVKKWYSIANEKLKYSVPNTHVPTGSCLSQKLAFLSYIDMFDEIYDYCNKNSIKMSVYVDDIVISSKKRISKTFVKNILFIFSEYGQEANPKKIKYYKKGIAKKITGIYINDHNQLKAPSKQHYDIQKLRVHIDRGGNYNKIESLIGKLRYVSMLESGKFKQLIKKYSKMKNTE